MSVIIATALFAMGQAALVRFPPEDFYLDADTAAEAVREGSQFDIIHPVSGMKIDVFSDRKDEVAKSQIECSRRLPALPGLTAAFSPADRLGLGDVSGMVSDPPE